MGTCESARPHWLRPHFMEAENLLRFDRFMELCLYDVEHGYYAKNINSVGTSGDFSTTPSLSPVLAIALSKAIIASGLHDVIEIGPGAGSLATQLLLQLKPPAFSFRKRIRYHLVERSAPLRALLNNDSVARQNSTLTCSLLSRSRVELALSYPTNLLMPFQFGCFREPMARSMSFSFL